MKSFRQFRTESTKTIQPLYVHRPLLNSKELIKWAKDNGLDTTLAPTDMHVTIVYSKEPVDWNSLSNETNELNVKIGNRDIAKFGDALVLKFSSDDLQNRWKEFRDIGASWDYPTYQPHVTLSYNAPKDLDITKITPYDGELKFGGEEYEVINTDKEFKEK